MIKIAVYFFVASVNDEIHVIDYWNRLIRSFNRFNVIFIMSNCFISAIFNVIMDNVKAFFVMNSLG